jgi:TolB protein
MMRQILRFFLFLGLVLLPYSAFAVLSIELTRGMASLVPIAIVPFSVKGPTVLPQDISAIINNDLQNSGRFKVYNRKAFSEFPSDVSAVSTTYFRKLGTDNVVIGKINVLGPDRYQVNFQLLNVYQGDHARVILNKRYVVSSSALRSLSHHISDLVYEQLTGIRGIFSTKIAYVLVLKNEHDRERYSLEVSDQDGYNPRPLLISPEPIMSPTWSPSGKHLAYVSFENRKSNIYLQDIASGTRQALSQFPGINGAPSFSPDGKKIALVLSKNGSPNIYIMDIATRNLAQITNDYYINTEPAWSQDGKYLLFTSTRSGGPQIYQVNLKTGSTSRLTYDGDYNARASFSRDGKNVVMIHRIAGLYSIALLDLDTGRMRVISNIKADSASPSIAPNSSMVLYDTVFGGKNILAMVSADGRIVLHLPARNGEAQDPAWSPFLS